jgi:hypothetical protein
MCYLRTVVHALSCSLVQDDDLNIPELLLSNVVQYADLQG